MDVVEDLNGNRVVVIPNIKFNGKRSIDWTDVEEYLKQYVGEFYAVADTRDIVFIGSDLPDEYSNSNFGLGRYRRWDSTH